MLKAKTSVAFIIIHGYGSSGKGGAIKEKVRQWLNAQARNGVIKCVINGEDFDIFLTLRLRNSKINTKN